MRRVVPVILALLLLASPAFASDDTGTTSGPSGDPVVYVGVPGSSAPGGASGGGGSVTCELHDFGGPTGGGGPGVGPGEVAQGPFVGGRAYVVVCTNPAGEVVYAAIVIYQPGTTLVDDLTLARQAYRELPLLYPDPHPSPPFNPPQLVGVATWLWIDQAQWQQQSATAAVL